ncbi:TRAP transporter small permease [Pseudooceanicola sediminis]|uniref:TRAP transporter small permease protein n=1 Tax=Pseudooceanicola sediminis TaxID=2211117 RepID=A0A399IW30_9RHOB|nr:TRAP transporter small permease [Pseudooceanicola sediminis]KAA2314963.1 TRAP transporter small permease [Puniceibacterium sp. HSS470]RII37335.1 TRAP transporter small permease [Pseudooceanicola sediminis]|tara:strand:- start:17553 stop:18068 length:516 start_codon:yes stop_codon:yes gene_type:complete
MPQLKRLLDGFAGLATVVACIVVVIMMLHVCADVAMRTFLNQPLIGTTEIVSAYYMVCIAFLPIAWIAKQRGHIIVELFTAGLSKRSLLRMDAVAGLATLIYVGVFCWQVVKTAIEKTHIHEAWEAATGYVEIWPSRWLIPVGFLTMGIYVIIQIVNDIRDARLPDEGEPQ